MATIILQRAESNAYVYGEIVESRTSSGNDLPLYSVRPHFVVFEALIAPTANEGDGRRCHRGRPQNGINNESLDGGLKRSSCLWAACQRAAEAVLRTAANFDDG